MASRYTKRPPECRRGVTRRGRIESATPSDLQRIRDIAVAGAAAEALFVVDCAIRVQDVSHEDYGEAVFCLLSLSLRAPFDTLSDAIDAHKVRIGTELADPIIWRAVEQVADALPRKPAERMDDVRMWRLAGCDVEELMQAAFRGTSCARGKEESGREEG